MGRSRCVQSRYARCCRMNRHLYLSGLQNMGDLLFSHNCQETTIQGKILLLIAQQSCCTAKFLEKSLQVNQSTISRETRALDKRGDRRHKERWTGRGLVCSYPDPMETRRLLYSLTDDGNSLVAEAIMVMLQAFSSGKHEASPACTTPLVSSGKS